MDDIPKWWKHTSIFLANAVSVFSFIFVVTGMMYLRHAHHLFFMIYAEFNIRAYTGFILIYNHFIWAHATVHWYGKKRGQCRYWCLANFFLSTFVVRIVLMSFFPELHRLNVALFHAHQFIFFRSRKHFRLANARYSMLVTTEDLFTEYVAKITRTTWRQTKRPSEQDREEKKTRKDWWHKLILHIRWIRMRWAFDASSTSGRAEYHAAHENFLFICVLNRGVH